MSDICFPESTFKLPWTRSYVLLAGYLVYLRLFPGPLARSAVEDIKAYGILCLISFLILVMTLTVFPLTRPYERLSESPYCTMRSPCDTRPPLPL
jgi:hypothetical protein